MKSAGADELPPRALNELAEILEPMEIMFTKLWKMSEVIRGLEKDQHNIPLKKEDWGNYRPVNLTPVPRKLLENIIRKHFASIWRTKG